MKQRSRTQRAVEYGVSLTTATFVNASVRLAKAIGPRAEAWLHDRLEHLLFWMVFQGKK